MLTDTLFSIIILLFVVFGLTRPYVALSGVVWVDTVTPQLLSYSFLAGKPLSMLLTLSFFLSVALNFQAIRSPKYKLPTFFLAVFALWIYLSTTMANHQSLAWFKFDIVIKIILIAGFIPFILDSKRKIEFFMWVFVSSVIFFTMIGGLKTLGGGGGYAVSVIQTSTKNSGITETSTLSIMAIVMLPLLYFLWRRSAVMAQKRYLRYYIYLAAFTAVLAAIGTYARSGLVCFMFLCFCLFLFSKKKALVASLCIFLVIASFPFLPKDWVERMSTLSDPNKEESALGRLVVWRWTIDYASENPWFGGGFYSYLDNKEQLHLYAGDDEEFDPNPKGKAFHSIIFEVLGELGFAGLFIYLCFIISAIVPVFKTYFGRTYEDWHTDISIVLLISIATFGLGGLFVGIAYMPWIFYLLFLSVSIRNVPREKGEA